MDVEETSGMRALTWRDEAAALIRGLPDKGAVGLLLFCWLALFQFLGNSTFGYYDTASLFGWLDGVYRNSADDAHGRMIPLVALGLIWMRRGELTTMAKGVWWPALGVVVFGLGLHVAGYLIQRPHLSLVGCVAGFYGLTGLMWGRRWMRTTAFPFFVLLFCVPLRTLMEPISVPLRTLSAQVSTGVATGLGVEVVRVGTQIYGAGGFQFDVAPACSGIRSLTVLVPLTTVYGFLVFQSAWRRLLMVSLAIPLAVLGNVIRISGVLVIAQAFGESQAMRFHDYAGYFTFGLALVCAFGVGRLLREPRSGPGEGGGP